VPHVVAWNLTRRCNLECAHCYIAAGPQETATGELTLDECLRIAGEILALNPSPIFILSGEPLLRRLTTIAASPQGRGATVWWWGPTGPR
jgi:MoaA/NifB/PqqE/SkfB family radical SAM enzyme